ncbi:MAG: hypothetical protein J7K21_04220, partial [Desulfurococcales archaeon]|nr:hypothetical protein [Desulfurococcales archaeon]
MKTKKLLLITTIIVLATIILQPAQTKIYTQPPTIWSSEELGDSVYSVCFSPDGKHIAVGGSFKKVVLLGVSSVVDVVLGCSTRVCFNDECLTLDKGEHKLWVDPGNYKVVIEPSSWI